MAERGELAEVFGRAGTDDETSDWVRAGHRGRRGFVAFGHAHAGDNGTKPAPEDIQPVRTIADPYPAFNGIAVDPANGLVAMSDPNRKSLLTYDRLRGASQGAASVPVHQVIGPDTFLGMIAGIVLDPQHREAYTANNDIEDTVVVMPYEATGNAKPSRIFSVPHQAWGLALGRASDEIAVTVEVQNTIVFYRRQVQGVEAPVRMIRGEKTGLADPHGIYWDEAHGELGVANHGNFKGVVQNTGSGCEDAPEADDCALRRESSSRRRFRFTPRRPKATWRRCARSKDRGPGSTGPWELRRTPRTTRWLWRTMATAPS